jgi:putative ABC transport system substrate-binding protein
MMMRRRTFIAGLGSTAAWPRAALAQQGERMRRIGVLLGWSESQQEARSWFGAFVGEMARLGWVVGRNILMDVRWTDYDVNRARTLAKELVESRPDLILSGTTPATAALRKETTTIPIVFAVATDPVGSGLVASISRPATNITGFAHYDGALAGKWLDLLRTMAPRMTRAGAMYNPDTAPFATTILVSLKTAASALGVEPYPIEVRSDREIEIAIETLGRERGGLVALTDSFILGHLPAIIAAANRSAVPAIFELDAFPRSGGLLSYGPSYADLFRRAAGYVDRIFNSERPADLPVQMPIRYELVINLGAAKTLGLSVPSTLLAIADEVIE